MNKDHQNVRRDLEQLRNRLRWISNVELLEEFCKVFNKFDHSTPKNDTEKFYILETSRIYIDEFRWRICNIQSLQTLKEFCRLMQNKLKQYSQGSSSSYMSNNLIRLYNIGIRQFKRFQKTKKDIKWDFL